MTLPTSRSTVTGKHPPSYRQADYDDPTEVSEVIRLADLLMRILDRM